LKGFRAPAGHVRREADKEQVAEFSRRIKEAFLRVFAGLFCPGSAFSLTALRLPIST
jgi:hypothetical protein